MKFIRTALISVSALLLSIGTASAQTQPSPERLAAIDKAVEAAKKEAIMNFPPRLQKALSGGALNYLQFLTAWQNIQKTFGNGPDSEAKLAALRSALESRGRASGAAVSSGPIPVSSGGADFLFSVMGGFTQSETSTAWCGSGAVVGFNDSGSVFESVLFGPGGISFSGAGVSSDGGASFRDIGPINPGPSFYNFLSGDPVLSCANSNTFYYSQIGSSSTGNGSSFAPTSVVFLSTSTDKGFGWNDPVPAVSKDAFSHGLDKDWSAIDPNHTKNLYVSYTDFDFSFTSCPSSERIAIEIVHSGDGGLTWSAPAVVDQVCSTMGQFVQGSQIAVDSAGHVYVEWEYFPTGFATDVRELRVARSIDHAASFGPVTKISDAIATGDGYALQGYFRTFLTGSLAVDRSGTKTDGTLYVVWEDGRLRSRIDLESPFGLYRNANVLLSKSTDKGKTWSSPTRVNTDALESPIGAGIDHYQPGVGVDSTGTVGACWYDRRDDPFDYQVTRYCGVSADKGASWTNLRVDPTIWPPIHGTDAFINLNYLGDYDTVASDQSKITAGFLGAYGNVNVNAPVANQDVRIVTLSK